MNLSCLCAINTRMQSCILPFVNLLFRIIVAYPFFISGLTKWEYVKNDQLDTLYFLFEDYNVPFLSVEYAAILATFGELILPILLVFGFMTRFAALGLLVMTALIYNADANPHAIYWAVILLYLCINGAGKISLDYWATKKWLL